MRICPSCNESYTYFNSYFGIDMCTSCGWSEDIDNNEGFSESNFTNNFFKEKDDLNSFKEKEVETKKEEISESSILN